MSEKEKKTSPARRPAWVRVLKAAGITLAALLLLVLAVITVGVSYLKPSRLTPLVERLANENLRADVSLERVEISFWSTFPRFDLDVQGLEVRTRAFDSIAPAVRGELPVWADSLLSVRRLTGAVNIPRLFTGAIHLYDITIDSPRVNLVQATPEAWSLDIFPPSEEKPDDDDAPLSLPDIAMGTFRIDGGFPVRYLSVPDSIDASVILTTTQLTGNDAPLYRLDIKGLAAADIPDLTVRRLGIGMGGDIRWDHTDPLRVTFDRFALRAGDVTLDFSSALDLADALRVETLDARLPLTPLHDIIALIPAGMRGELDKVDANFSLASDVKLTRPFTVGVDSLPSFTLKVNIPEGSVSYDGMKLDRLALDLAATVDGADLDRSAIDLKELSARGEGMGFRLEATAARIISDPVVKGCFKGGLNVARLPRAILSQIPCKVKGVLVADCDFDLRRSYLDKENFHRIKLKGEATLSGLDIDMPEMPLHIYSREMEMKLGTQSSLLARDTRVDSLLTASLAIDTLACIMPGIDLHGSGLKLGVGCRNTSSTKDTTLINPIGGRILAERLMLRSSEDSMRVRLRKAQVGAALTRYKGDARKPLLHLDISTERAFYGDRLNRAALVNAFTSVTIHPSTPRVSPRMQARIDSLRRLYPSLPADSLRRMAFRRNGSRPRTATPADTAGTEMLDLELDNSMKRLLRQWNAHGSLRADRMRLFTPLFPLRNRVTGLDVRFNSDSIIISDTHIRVGRSDFKLDGTVSNITRALTASSARRPLRVNLDMRSDTIDINEIAAAVFAGAAFAEKDNGLISVGPAGDDDDDMAGQEAVAQAIAEDSAMAVLVIPSNVEATLTVNAANIIYSNLPFRDFHGVINAYRGALNLSELAARSDVGSLGLNALYSAPTKHDASFAFGLNVKDFNIGEFLGLIPAIDSLMPMLQGIRGIINADLAATTQIDSAMNIDIPSLKAAMKISGDSLQVIDKETFRKIGKWLLFKDKNHNIIDSMTVEMIVNNSQLRMFPFMFNLDRYKLGVSGSNDMAMNFNYHVAVLKSPIPFKFGINVSGNPNKMKIRLGRARFNEKNFATTVSIADTTRINLVNEIRNVFRRGVSNARVRRLDFGKVAGAIEGTEAKADTITHADSLYFINQGLIPAPDTVPHPAPAPADRKKRKK